MAKKQATPAAPPVVKRKPITITADLDVRETVIVSVSEYNGKWRLDIRHFWQDDAGEFKPSKKGINILLDEAEDLISTIQLAVEGSIDAEAG